MNFRTLCTGELGNGLEGKPLHYKGSTFHRIIPGFIAQGGDITHGNGVGGESIFGHSFNDENFDVKHSRPYMLSMANSGPNTNTSQFFITFVPTPWLDGKHTVFGVVLKGQQIVQALEKIGSESGATTKKAIISDSGELFEDEKEAE